MRPNQQNHFRKSGHGGQHGFNHQRQFFPIPPMPKRPILPTPPMPNKPPILLIPPFVPFPILPPVDVKNLETKLAKAEDMLKLKDLEMVKLRAENEDKEKQWEEEKDNLQMIMMERDERDKLKQDIARMKLEKDAVDTELARAHVDNANLLIKLDKVEKQLAKYKKGSGMLQQVNKFDGE